MVPVLKLQNTCASLSLPLVRFRNLNIMTFWAAGMLVLSQKSGGGSGASGTGAASWPVDASGPPLVSSPTFELTAPLQPSGAASAATSDQRRNTHMLIQVL